MSGQDAMKTAGTGVKLTYDDFLLFPDDGERHEPIDVPLSLRSRQATC